MPTMPHSEAGWRIEPPVSVPVAPIASPAATAAADPPDEPPGTSFVPGGDQGLVTGPNALLMLEEPMANSSRLVLPMNTAPSRSKLAVTLLS